MERANESAGSLLLEEETRTPIMSLQLFTSLHRMQITYDPPILPPEMGREAFRNRPLDTHAPTIINYINIGKNSHLQVFLNVRCV
jgi:hypothetical protein